MEVAKKTVMVFVLLWVGLVGFRLVRGWLPNSEANAIMREGTDDVKLGDVLNYDLAVIRSFGGGVH